jgi:hypothetical protein
LCMLEVSRGIPLAIGVAPAMMDALLHSNERVPGPGEGRMEAQLAIRGAIIDSWVEPSGPPARGKRLVLQVAPRGGRPGDMMIVEAAASLVPDHGWLEDLGENMCHGSPVEAVGRLSGGGQLRAEQLRLVR